MSLQHFGKISTTNTCGKFKKIQPKNEGGIGIKGKQQCTVLLEIKFKKLSDFKEYYAKSVFRRF